MHISHCAPCPSPPPDLPLPHHSRRCSDARRVQDAAQLLGGEEGGGREEVRLEHRPGGGEPMPFLAVFGAAAHRTVAQRALERSRTPHAPATLGGRVFKRGGGYLWKLEGRGGVCILARL